MKKILSCGYVLIFLSLPSLGKAENGVSKDKIIVGASLPLSGPNGLNGQEVLQGVKAYIHSRINATGGVYGRKVEFKPLDDKYLPQTALENTKALIEQEKVFALLSPFGTPNLMATLPLVEKAGVPEVGAISGEERLRIPPIKNVFCVRAGFTTEGTELITRAKELGYKRIAIVSSEGTLGTGVRAAISKAIHEAGLELVGPDAPFEISADSVKSLQQLKPDAVVLWTFSNVAAEFVKQAQKLDFKPDYLAASMVFSTAFVETEGRKVDGLIGVLSVPYYKDESYEIVRLFKNDMNALQYPLNQRAIEGYINAAVFHEALKKAGKDLTREDFIHALDTMTNVVIKGVPISFSSENHEGLGKVFPLQYRKGKFYPADQSGLFTGRGY